MNKLQKALQLNAIFSSISGLILILFNKQIAKSFGTDNNTVFWIVGLVLIYFATTIWYEISKQRKIAVLWIITQDFLWVIGSLILVVFNPFSITVIGNSIIGVVALMVLFMGINQSKALAKQTVN
ncbi:hypothetical protein N9Y48_00045 [Zobellia sp.]|nr:hypothetical protein [Zobellia sp.]